MNEQELRALVRESIAKQLGEPAPVGQWHGRSAATSPDARIHGSHGVYTIAREDERPLHHRAIRSLHAL